MRPAAGTTLRRPQVVQLKRRKLPEVRVTTADGDAVRPRQKTADRIDYRIPANGRVILSWS